MNLIQHPEYSTVYVQNQEANQGCKKAVEAWLGAQKPIQVDQYSITWTPASMLSLVHELSEMFQAYNQVLWKQFHYCQQCGGQCCVVDASDIRPFDLIAVALLNKKAPLLPDRIRANVHDCIYLSGTRCTWPDSWRTIKCWSFYCLGSGPWDATASLGDLYREITQQLVETVRSHLPEALRRYESVHHICLTDSLDDPVAFSNTLHRALDNLFVQPFHNQYPLFELKISSESPTTPEHANPRSNIFLLVHDTMTFIAETTERLFTDPPTQPEGISTSLEQFFEDLETLEWLMMGEPTNKQTMLDEMYGRYADAPIPSKGESGSIWYEMRNQILYLLNK
ncbi:hypothetical protein KFU94_58960 [Chloroflexi bacterium TSY]|nr:hypothetical protein [Chloroflexi bacterium TSY]